MARLRWDLPPSLKTMLWIYSGQLADCLSWIYSNTKAEASKHYWLTACRGFILILSQKTPNINTVTITAKTETKAEGSKQ